MSIKRWFDKNLSRGCVLDSFYNAFLMFNTCIINNWSLWLFNYSMTSNFAKSLLTSYSITRGITILHQSFLRGTGVRTSQEHRRNRWGLTSLRTASSPTDDAALTFLEVVDSVTWSFLLEFHRLITSCGVGPWRKLRPVTLGVASGTVTQFIGVPREGARILRG